jgi:hypothetical protein
VELYLSLLEKKGKTKQEEYRSNTLGFRKKHYKFVNGIKSTFVGKEKKQTKGIINQIPQDLARSTINV